jgi:N-acetylmuramoyl-L-alanine amidase
VKKYIVIIFLTVAFMFSAFNQVPPRNKIKTIVIDAGHGGHDPGCNGGDSKEKNVTLSIALKLGKLIKDSLDDVKVIYTRDDDTFVELYERSAIANRNNADIFISIHCNANKNKDAYGTETYAMGLHKTTGWLDVAKRENASILQESDYEKNYDGFDPTSPEAHIMFSLYQNAYLDQSLVLASKVEDQFREHNRVSRGVKQAGFLVLWKTTMPSILIETGFLSNASERKVLSTESGQKEVALSIFKAVKQYKQLRETSK